MRNNSSNFRIAVVGLMLPLALVSGAPAASCVCADGHVMWFCRGYLSASHLISQGRAAVPSGCACCAQRGEDSRFVAVALPARVCASGTCNEPTVAGADCSRSCCGHAAVQGAIGLGPSALAIVAHEWDSENRISRDVFALSATDSSTLLAGHDTPPPVDRIVVLLRLVI